MPGLDAQLASGEALEHELAGADAAERVDELDAECRRWHADILATLSKAVPGGPGGEASDRYSERLPPIRPRGRSRTADEILADLRVVHVRRLERLRSIRGQVRAGRGGPAGGQDVFVVHGRDSVVHEVARALQQMTGRAPVILHEKPSQGRTIVEKFEDCADEVGAAVVILSTDDEGRLRDEPDGGLRPRARQNVVYELGWFHGRLGRGKVVALLVGDVERPSDIDGVLYVPMDGAWKLQLARELREAGIEVDLNNVA